jgi:transcriptional regulator with XRE-family HTH domain
MNGEPIGEPTFGERLRQRRERVGMSRPVFGGLVGRSAEWVKAVETGRLAMPRLQMLLRIAEVLGINDLADLTGDPSRRIDRFMRGQHPATPAIQDAVQRYTVSHPDEPPYPVSVLRDRVDAAWRSWHQADDRRTAVGEVLPALLVDGRVAALTFDGLERRAAHAALADAYHLAQHTLVNAADPALLWMVADRAMAAAQIADRPLALAGGAWTVGIMMRAAGRMDESLALVREAAHLLEPGLPDAGDEWRAMWGALQLHGAVTAARAGRDGEAWSWWDRADAVARTLPPGYMHPWTAFGAANTAVHAVSLTVDLWKSREALRRAEAIDPDTIPSRERRGRFFVEMARGHHAAGDRIASTRLLLRACDEGVDAVRWSPAARVIVDDLVTHPPPAVREDVAALAARLDVPLA